MANQTKNYVVALIKTDKALKIVETKETDWPSIYAHKGFGSGRQKKDVVQAWYCNPSGLVVMEYIAPERNKIRANSDPLFKWPEL